MADSDQIFEGDPEDFDTADVEAEDASDAPTSSPPADRERPKPHLRKLKELLRNDKLDVVDLPLVRRAVERYHQWIEEMSSAHGQGEDKVTELVKALNSYKRHIELDLIWDSRGPFLFRNRGQTKLDNSVIEEFLPWLVDPAIVPELAENECMAGPRKAFAAASFTSTLLAPGRGGDLLVRTKDQDFALSRRAYLQSSFDRRFPPTDTSNHEVHLAYVAAECKTNLDKTMFQEASATAHDLRVAMPGSRYYLVAEYLDMRPISTAGTDIEEVLILRGRRMGAQLRKNNSDWEERSRTRENYVEWLDSHPVRSEVVLRFVKHLRALFADGELADEDVIARGYF